MNTTTGFEVMAFDPTIIYIGIGVFFFFPMVIIVIGMMIYVWVICWNILLFELPEEIQWRYKDWKRERAEKKELRKKYGDRYD